MKRDHYPKQTIDLLQFTCLSICESEKIRSLKLEGLCRCNVNIENQQETCLQIGTNVGLMIKPGFHYTANATTTTQQQSDYKIEQSSFTLIAFF